MTTRPGGRYNPNERATASRPIDAPQTLVGRVLESKYRLLRMISEGGMGIIFEAIQLTVRRKVAVKILRPSLSEEGDLIRRFQQEVEAVATLAHPNIVTLIDAGSDTGGVTYLVMEFVEGETLRHALAAKKLTLAQILRVFGQTCDALAEAHGAGIIHRDLKFDNLMLQNTRDNRIHVKVLDFGVAKLLRSDSQLTRGGQVPGTPGIIAPELAANNVPSPRSDVYSLGVLLYTTLAGEAPFRGNNDLDLMRAHQMDPLPPLAPHVQEYVPLELVRSIEQMLSKDPSERPADALRVRSELDAAREKLEKLFGRLPPYVPPRFEAPPSESSKTFRAPSPRVPERAGAWETEGAAAAATAEMASRRPRPSPLLLLVVGGAIAIAIAIATILLQP